MSILAFSDFSCACSILRFALQLRLLNYLKIIKQHFQKSMKIKFFIRKTKMISLSQSNVFNISSLTSLFVLSLKNAALSRSHGVWGRWTIWSDCSRTCGKAIRFRRRHCGEVRKVNKKCNGDAMEKEHCKLIRCPGNQARQDGAIALTFYQSIKKSKNVLLEDKKNVPF